MAESNLSETWLPLIYSSRQLRACGHYDDARKLFDKPQSTSLSQNPKPTVCEIAWSYLNEGDYNSAAGVLATVKLEENYDGAISHDCDALLRLQKAYVDMRRTGSVDDCLELCAKMEWEVVPARIYDLILLVIDLIT
jgi:hypothetical protein